MFAETSALDILATVRNGWIWEFFILSLDIASASHFSCISWFVQSIFVIRRIRFQPSVNPAVFLIHGNRSIAVAFMWRSEGNSRLFLIIFKLIIYFTRCTEKRIISRVISGEWVRFFSPVKVSLGWIGIASFIELQIALLFCHQLFQDRVLVHLKVVDVD